MAIKLTFNEKEPVMSRSNLQDTNDYYANIYIRNKIRRLLMAKSSSRKN